ncbi:alpha-ribazole phosphatase family protein [Telluria mixta]|uniref:Alpha-ribazole phosphatase family protein n=1 Tax=Telluria mixta TaxID=34071 RepID=A0ABT2CB27_9BURK|nr:alpha-ribazole phosphatase family protein [Telluria mixta]MCS0633991.1 alpha-ribazole phosphatase family protein [Telluria mixta]WEM97098.1 alpha-ribazole phosphatase family protein [Telluria mixta]
MTLYLVRHPQPDVAPGLCYGASDVPVTDSELARVHAGLAVPSGLPVYASPLQRCALLAAHLAPGRVTLDARLAEMNFGAWELRPWSDIPRADVDAWTADLLHYRPGGAENVLDVARRVQAFVADLRTPSALIVCHAGTIRLLAALHGGAPLEQAALNAAQTPHRIGYGQLVVLGV